MNHIIKRDENKLVKKVFIAQRSNPVQGDFVKLVEKGLKNLGLSYEHVTSSQMKGLVPGPIKIICIVVERI